MPKKTHEQTRQADFFNVCENCPISCCSDAHPPVTAKRTAIVQEYLKNSKIAIEKPFKKNIYSFPRETADKHCVFLDKSTKKCRIHFAKPETCAAGPVTFDINLKTGRIEWFLKTEKICPLAGALYRDKKALKSHLECARTELLKLVHDLDAEALCAILKIEEPDTFKIGEEDLNSEVLTKLKSSI
jgi:Fe-S-cluster containining protein